MIDFIHAEKTFKQYLQNYNRKDGNIKLKIVHTYEVIKQSENIAKNLGLEEEDIQLAKLIALLHDIGRFEQVKITKNFTDNKKIDHASYGVKMLFENNQIRNYLEETKQDAVIKKAIANHSKYKIEEGLSQKEALHSKIIRDADKIDNFRVKEKENFENIFPGKYNEETISYETVSPKVFKDFMEHRCIKLEDRNTQIDYWVCVIAFLFDLNFEISLKKIEENQYIDKLVDRIEYKNKETKRQMEQIRQEAKKYIETKKQG